MNGWDFMSQHPIVTVLLALIIAGTVIAVVRMILTRAR